MAVVCIACAMCVPMCMYPKETLMLMYVWGSMYHREYMGDGKNYEQAKAQNKVLAFVPWATRPRRFHAEDSRFIIAVETEDLIVVAIVIALLRVLVGDVDVTVASA